MGVYLHACNRKCLLKKGGSEGKITGIVVFSFFLGSLFWSVWSNQDARFDNFVNNQLGNGKHPHERRKKKNTSN